MTPEGKILAAILRCLKAMKAEGESIFFVKLHGSPMQRAGLPDLLLIYRGNTLAIEVKKPDGKATKLQLHTLKEMEMAGATAVVVRSVEDVIRVMETSRMGTKGK